MKIATLIALVAMVLILPGCTTVEAPTPTATTTTTESTSIRTPVAGATTSTTVRSY